ncbi:hypothetical protein [Pseudoruegeria sp. SK021]|uniref:hypothetical protein n=1 Tax=Pseudoruegeria sp. SK021 TaxID=1933035 RepID=UPI000A22AAE3|nr:hypothetical protein [Pseudoruegeria sp. SK021]OSP55662.1 hypothetical protein BV911_05995 [Pseudoruegeria sp. SK021]
MSILKLSDDHDRALKGGTGILLFGLLAGLCWVGVYVTLFWRPIVDDGPAFLTWLMRGLGIGLPLVLIAVATGLAQQAGRLRNEASSLRNDIDHLRTIQRRAEQAVRERRDAAPDLSRSAPAAPLAVGSQHDASATDPLRAEPQASLPLDPQPMTAQPRLSVDDLIRALHFPETPDDTEGFQALRRALRDHRAGQVVRAAQDILTLLSQDGLYMDDLVPDRARPEQWRRFALGERGPELAELGGIRDENSLAICSTRLSENTVFRDATHHFLRRFDQLLADAETSLSDQDWIDLTDTRSARAFMLLGRSAGIFDRG